MSVHGHSHTWQALNLRFELLLATTHEYTSSKTTHIAVKMTKLNSGTQSTYDDKNEEDLIVLQALHLREERAERLTSARALPSVARS